MHLENQIEYEYHALELLADSGRTPVPVFVDGSKEGTAVWYDGYGVSGREYTGLSEESDGSGRMSCGYPQCSGKRNGWTDIAIESTAGDFG